MTASLTPPQGALPTIQEQFKTEDFEPIRTQQLADPNLRSSIEVAFEQAKEQYQQKHGHQFPYSLRTFCRTLYRK